MPTLDPGLRGALDKAIVRARAVAERAAEATLISLAVDQRDPFATHTLEQRRLRNALRARARQLGGGTGKEGAGFPRSPSGDCADAG